MSSELVATYSALGSRDNEGNYYTGKECLGEQGSVQAGPTSEAVAPLYSFVDFKYDNNSTICNHTPPPPPSSVCEGPDPCFEGG